MYEDPAFRPLRWIGAVAVFGVISAALAVLAWEAIGESFTFIGDGRAQSDTVILATEAADPAGSGEAAQAPATDPGEAGSEQADSGGGPGDGSPGDAGGSGEGAEAPGGSGDGGSGDADPPAAIYEVEPGDTGTSIARELFGRQDAWDDIAEFNGMSPGETLQVGEVLQIPEL